MIVIIDNYDSFTYNLAHSVKELGAETDVLRNDCFDIKELERYDKIILSPGPGTPDEAGLLLDVIRTYAGRKSILGVCLGEQAIGQVFGGKLTNLDEVFTGYRPKYESVTMNCRTASPYPISNSYPSLPIISSPGFLRRFLSAAITPG